MVILIKQYKTMGRMMNAKAQHNVATKAKSGLGPVKVSMKYKTDMSKEKDATKMGINKAMRLVL